MIRQGSSYLDVENYTGDIAILGGSFNPIHVGHIRMAESFYEQFGIDIVLMPNKTTYYKENKAFVPDEDRLNMLSLVAEHYPYMFYSDLEIVRGGVTHTIDTIRELRKANNNRDIYFVIGGDSLEWIDKWVDAEELISSVHFVSAIRGETDLERTKAIIKRLNTEYPKSRISILDMADTPVSSSEIRNRIAEGLDISGLVPDYINDYIQKNSLFKGEQ